MKSEIKWPKLILWFLAKPKTAGFLVFLALTIIVGFVVLQRYQIVKEYQKQEMNAILEGVHQNIEQSLKNCYTTTLTLALTINDDGFPESFDAIGAQLLASNKSINAVQLVPNGVIKYIYPLEGNEAALNFDILNAPLHKKEALKSVERKKMYFGGPVELIQGGVGIVGRLPVFFENKFWGFSAVLLKLETLLDQSGIHAVDANKYYFQFSKTDPNTQKEVFFLDNKEDFSEQFHESVVIPDGDWKLYLISKNKYILYYQILPVAVFGFIMALLFGFLITTLLRKPAELQLLVFNQATKLLNSEIKFKTIFEQAPVGIAHVDSYSGLFLEINEQYCKLLGYSKEEMKSKNFPMMTHPDDLAEGLFYMNQLKEGQIREFSIEKRYFNKSGKTIWVNLTVSPLWKVNEKPTTHIAIVEDVTQQKEVENIVRKSETRFRSLFDDSPIALWEEDFSEVKKHLAAIGLIGKKPEIVRQFLSENPEIVLECISLVKIIDVNNQCLLLHQSKSKEELTTNLNSVIDVDSRDSFISQLVAITANKTRFFVESRIKTFEGEYRDIELRWSVIKGYEDSLERVILSTEDITERKQSAKIILESQQKIESLINSIDGIVWECDAKTQELTFISKKTEEILGYTAEEWLKNPHFWEDHLHPDDKAKALPNVLAIITENKNYDLEYRMIARDGSIVWFRDIINIIAENGRASSQRGIMIDITKTKEAENDLKNSFELVSEQNKRLLNFSYIVSHNLRSHSSNIQSISNLIETAESDEERDEMIQLLKKVSGNLNETMSNLNEIINIQTNTELTVELLNMNEYINRTLGVISGKIMISKAEIINLVSDELYVNYNPAYLESILLNLISNAIRYRNPKLNPIITIQSLMEDGHTILQISDNGIGIDLKKNGDKIFGMYKTFSNNPNSRGIGLFITKNQIDAMGGKISVESELNKGSIFKIYFK